jgi:hypothetical protein
MCLDNKKLSVLDWDMVTNPWMYCRTPEKQHKKPHKEGSMFHDFCLRERFRWGSCLRIPFFIFGFLNVFDCNDLQVFRRWIVSRLLTCSFGIIFCRISLFGFLRVDYARRISQTSFSILNLKIQQKEHLTFRKNKYLNTTNIMLHRNANFKNI